MKIIFLGTPEFALDVLKAVESAGHCIAAVITQPDRINARGKKIVPPPVKTYAGERGYKVYQFEKISREGAEILKELDADIMITAAYGQILSAEILKICPRGVINAHASLLPKYRGASPVQCAIINGEKETGITVMNTALSVDSGEIIAVKKLPLSGKENAVEAMSALGKLAGQAVTEALSLIEKGEAVYRPQNHAEATFCKKFEKDDYIIDLNKGAESVVNLIRGLYPDAYLNTKRGRLKLLKAEIDGADYENADAGVVVRADKNGVSAMCKDKPIRLLEVQGEGGKAMTAAEYFRGKPAGTGEIL